MIARGKIQGTVLTLFSLSPILILALAGWSLFVGERRDGFPNSDIVVYSIVAKLWNEGFIPYRDIADHKPPVMYIFLRLCFLLGGNSPVSIWRGFDILTALGGCALFLGFRAARLGWVGLGSSLAFVIFFWQNPLGLGEPAFLNTEQLATALLALSYGALLVFTSSRASLWGFLSGTLFSLAVMAKQPAAIFGLPLFAHLLFYPWGPGGISARSLARRIGAFAVGGVFPVALVVAFFAYHNALQDLWYWTYTANLYYAPVTRMPFSYISRIWVENASGVMRHLGAPSALAYETTLIIAPVLLLIRRSWIDVVACAWLVSAFASLAVNIQSGHTHYFLFFQTPLSVALGVSVCGVAFVLCKCVSLVLKVGRLEGALSLTMCAVVFYSNGSGVYRKSLKAFTYPGESLQGGATGAQIRQFAESINPSEKPAQFMFYYGQDPSIFFYGNFKPASKYIYPMGPGMGVGFKEDVVASARRVNAPYGFFTHEVRPESLPTEGEGFASDLGRLLRQNYELVSPGPGGYLYRRKDLPPPF